MKKLAVLFACAALLGAGAAFGGMFSEDPGELTVSGQAFLPDHADCDLFSTGYGALVSYREWFSFPWGVGLSLGISQWQVDDEAEAFKVPYLSDYDGDALVVPVGLSLYFNLIDWDNWNLILETGLQYAFVESSIDLYNDGSDAKERQDVDIGNAVLWNAGIEYEYMVAENLYLLGSVGYQLDVAKGDTEYDGHGVRDASFAAGYARLGAKFLF